jgi:hypothetical protein
MNTEMNTELNTPTPRTDDAQWGTGRVTTDFARTLERELAESRNAERLARVQLGNEREKVRALRLACERIVEQWDKNHDAAPFHAGNVMYSRASAALAATEDAQ